MSGVSGVGEWQTWLLSHTVCDTSGVSGVGEWQTWLLSHTVCDT